MELASLAQLERSHRRHDEVIVELLDAARRLAAGRPTDGDVQSVREAVAYFNRAVTRHFLDEEGSVFPRLSTRRPELAPDLAALSAEHPAQIALQGEVATAARELDGEARPAAGKALLDAATRLAEAHRAHVAREDELFRVAHDALTAEDDLEIYTEMETRRDREDQGGRHRHNGAPTASPKPSAKAAATKAAKPAATLAKKAAGKNGTAPGAKSAGKNGAPAATKKAAAKSAKKSAKPTAKQAVGKSAKAAGKNGASAAKKAGAKQRVAKPAKKTAKPVAKKPAARASARR